MSPDHWSKLTWDTVSAGGYDLFDPIGYLDRKRDRAYNQRVIVTPVTKESHSYSRHHVLEECSSHDFSDLQFGFVKGRRIEIATALLHDVIDYSTTRGSVVYSCSMDAEGAFDAIPHCILFDKAQSVLPSYC